MRIIFITIIFFNQEYDRKIYCTVYRVYTRMQKARIMVSPL